MVRLTPDELADLQGKADAAGLSVPRYLFDAATGSTPAPDRRVVVTELFAVRRQVQGIAANVNQLAHSANVGATLDPVGMAEAMGAVRGVLARLDALLDGAT